MPQDSLTPECDYIHDAQENFNLLRGEVQLVMTNNRSDWKVTCPSCQTYATKQRLNEYSSDRLNQSLEHHGNSICPNVARPESAAPAAGATEMEAITTSKETVTATV